MKVKDRKNNRPEGWLDSGWKVPVHLTVKQERYAWREMGIARFAFNLALKTHAFHRANRMQWPFVSDIQKASNACKREEYPFVLEVSKFVAQGGFRDFEKAVKNWPGLQPPGGKARPAAQEGRQRQLSGQSGRGRAEQAGRQPYQASGSGQRQAKG